jgi:hypothetical protein
MLFHFTPVGILVAAGWSLLLFTSLRGLELILKKRMGLDFLTLINHKISGGSFFATTLLMNGLALSIMFGIFEGVEFSSLLAAWVLSCFTTAFEILLYVLSGRTLSKPPAEGR